LAACNSGETKEEAKPADTTAVAPAPAPAADTTAMKADTAAAAK